MRAPKAASERICRFGVKTMSTLRASCNISEATVQRVVECTNAACENVVDDMSEEVQAILGGQLNEQLTAQIMQCMAGYSKPLEFVATQAKRDWLFYKDVSFIRPVGVKMGTSGPPGDETSHEFWHIPIHELLAGIRQSRHGKLWFQRLKKILKSRNGRYVYFADGEAYTRNPYFNDANVLVIPIAFYMDDIEVCNPLAPKSGE
jgi:hypothetical protein